MSPQHIMSLAFILIVILTSILALVFAIWKKCRFASSTLRTCFTLYLLSSYHRGICRADIFVEVTNVANCKMMWAHFKHIAVHPTLLKGIGYLNSSNITIYKTCCFKSMIIDWERVGVTSYHNERLIPIPGVGTISIWTSGDLDCINADEQYQIRILGRVLDQIYDIPMDVELTIGAAGGDYIQYEEQDSPPRPLHSAPEGPPYPRVGTPLVKLPTVAPSMPTNGHEIEMSEFLTDRPQTVYYHSINRGRCRTSKHDKPPAYRQ